MEIKLDSEKLEQVQENVIDWHHGKTDSAN